MSSHSDDERKRLAVATQLVHSGRDKSLTGPFVNPPVVHASTVLFDSVETMHGRKQRYQYGRRGTPTSEALETAVTELEGATGTVLCPSGLSAATTALLASVSAGDHVLIVDCVYAPVRHFADTVLKQLGVSVTYFRPDVGAGIEALFTDRTTVVYLEAPGSITFEMQDVPLIAEIAHRRRALVLFDNTWSTPLFFRPLVHGVDLSIHAGTKYLNGHSDVMFGTIAANAGAWPRLKETHGALGMHVAPDDVYLVLRGLRTLAIRLERHQASAMKVASFLADRPEVSRVLYPALPTDSGHAIWKRDWKGASGLFSVVFRDWTEAQAKVFVNGLRLFGIGASWGGFESLAVLSHQVHAERWHAEGQIVRLHIGLEDPADLIADLEASFTRVAAGQSATAAQ